MMRDAIKLGAKLLLITAIAGLLLGFTNEITKEPIRVQNESAMIQARQGVLPVAASFDEIDMDSYTDSGIDNAFCGKDENGNIIGYTAQITVKGYGGEIEVTIGVDTDCIITGVNVGGSNFSETAGLGAKSKSPEFTDQFIGKVYEIILKKASETNSSENTVDAITSATITSNAVVGGVNSALSFLSELCEHNIGTVGGVS